MTKKRPKRPGRRLVLNSAVCTTGGVYWYREIDIDAAINWLGRGPFESFIGYAETAARLGYLTGFDIPMRREAVYMKVGDEALVYRIVGLRPKLAEKGHIDDAELAAISTWGLMSKMSLSQVTSKRL